MDRSYPSALRIKQRRQQRQRILAGAFAALAVGAMAFAMDSDRTGDGARAPAAAAAAPLTAAAPAPAPTPTPIPARRVYRYSVVPGGAASGEALAHVLARDQVVAAHYAGFEVGKAHLVTVRAPRAVYVSYRKGDKVYWTAKKVMLQVGESLLTDGVNEMRARCANRISDAPRLPVEVRAPQLAALDALEDAPDEHDEGGLENVDAAALTEPGELPVLDGQSFQPIWPDPVPNRATDPAPRRTGAAGERAPAFPWPWMGWLSTVPQMPDLATLSPPPALGSNEVAPPAAPDLGPLLPKPDPARPTAPASPELPVPAPAAVAEPASAWLFALALLALLALRRQR